MIHKTYKFEDGRQLEIIHDDSPESPREWDNLGVMACFHKRGNYGDEGHGIDQDDYNGWDEMEAGIRKEYPDCVILPIYMYSHSGETISTTPFSCPWDSGQLGFIFVSREKIDYEYGYCCRTNEQIEEYLRNEVAVYDQYITGDVFGFILREPPCETCDGEGEEGDSCWGFYGDNPLENGMSDHVCTQYIKEVAEQRGEKVAVTA